MEFKVNLSIYDNVSISSACKDYLDSIEGLEYYLCGLFFYWKIGKMSGACEWTDEFETAILNAKPTNKCKLIKLFLIVLKNEDAQKNGILE